MGSPPTLPADFFDRKSPGVKPPLFDFDAQHSELLKNEPPEKQTQARSGLANFYYNLGKQFEGIFYSGMEGVNAGAADFFEKIDYVDRWYEAQGWPGGTFSKKMAEVATNRRDYYSQKAKEVGTGFLNEMIGEAVGGFAPGTVSFLIDLASLFTLPAIAVYQKVKEANEPHPAIHGLVQAAEEGVLAYIFSSVGPFSRKIKSFVLGTTFGIQEAAQAPAGEKLKGFARGFGTGLAFGVASPGGHTLREVYPDIGKSAPDARAKLEALIKETQQDRGNLRPAIQFGDQVVEGKEGETHPDIIARESVSRGITEEKPSPEAPETTISEEARVTQGDKGDLSTVLDVGAAGRGFVGPDGNFMTRDEAKAWVKQNQPEIYNKWMAKTGNEAAEFHSEDYNEAAGISTSPIAGIPNDPDIGYLTQQLASMPKDADLKSRIDAAEKAAASHTGLLARAQNAWAKLKSIGTALSSWYFNPPSSTEFDVMFGKYLGSREISGMKTEQWAKEIQDSIPRDRQEAITKWIRVNGDERELQRRTAEATNPANAKKYRDALTLTPDEKRLAQNIRAYYDRMLDRAIQSGVLETGINDYVNRVYKVRPNETTDSGEKLSSQAQSGLLQKNPSFAKKRFYEHDWEAEQEGAELEDRIGYLIAIYQKSFDEAIAARQFVKDLASGTASDGRPLVAMRGSGHVIPKGEEPPQAYIISPKTRPKPRGFSYVGEVEEYPSETNLADYKEIDHPALRSHKWVAADQDGTPIFLDADMIVHPEAYTKLKNALQPSAIKKSVAGRAMLKGSGVIKGTILGFFSSFHQVHLAQHALTHWVNPFSPDEIDFNNPMHKDLIEHGLKLYDGDALNEFMEGVQGPGLTKYIPYIGKWAQAYTDYLFKAPTGYIPRLKMKLAAELFSRNSSRYKNLNRDQLMFLSADQANAALGGVNYKAIGRNPTAQDILRLGALAPDFLEARARFVGQAFAPYGREQFTAMAIRGAVGMYVATKVIEGIGAAIDPEHNKLHLDEPFSVTLWGKSYSVRSVQGDLEHLWKDPRGFIYNRLNPALVRPAIEALTGRDQFGRLKDFGAQLKDWAVGSLPIAGQGYFTRRDYNLYQTILQSSGISSWDYRTEAQQLMRQKQMAKAQAPAAEETQERRKIRIDLTDKLAQSRDREPIRKALKEKKITANDVVKIFNTAFEGDLETGMKGLTLPESLEIWKASNEDEKALVQQALVDKWLGWDATEKEREAFQDQFNEVFQWRTKPKEQKRFSILGR